MRPKLIRPKVSRIPTVSARAWQRHSRRRKVEREVMFPVAMYAPVSLSPGDAVTTYQSGCIQRVRVLQPETAAVYGKETGQF